MKNKQLLGVFMIFCLSIIFTGCGNTGAGTKNSTQGILQGYICNKGDNVQIVAEDTLPAGFTAASGAKISVDTIETVATADSQGHFLIPDVTTGDRIITVAMPESNKQIKFVTTVAKGASVAIFAKYTGK